MLLLTPTAELDLSLLYRRRSPHAGRALDRRGVDAAVHHPPGRVVPLVELDPAANPLSIDLLEVEPGNPYELAGRYFRVISFTDITPFGRGGQRYLDCVVHGLAA